jgi:predicted nucleic acid-binding protein
MVLVDTPIWSLGFRRRIERLSAAELRQLQAWRYLVREDEASIIGPVRQEVLSGIREPQAFDRIRLVLRPFPDEPLTLEDFEEAAHSHNVCRAAGVAGSAVDFLVCAVALRREIAIYTADQDFARYAQHLPLRLHEPSF